MNSWMNEIVPYKAKAMELLGDLFAIFTTIVIFLLGEVNEAMQAFLVLLLIDYATGVRKAWHTATLSSKIGATGLEKKFRTILVIAVSHLTDKVLGIQDSKLSLKFAMLLVYSCNETLSILENLRAVGTWIPSLMTDKLEQVRNTGKFQYEKSCQVIQQHYNSSEKEENTNNEKTKK